MYYIELKMLMGDKGNYMGIILGISFAALIMTQQPGVFLGIMSRAYSFVSDISLPDIWVMDARVKYIDDVTPLPSARLYQVASIKGIEWAVPLYKGSIQARLANGTFQTCNVIGIDDATLIGGPGKMLEGRLEDLRQSNSVIVSHEGATGKLAGLPKYKGGPKTPLRVGDTLELNDNHCVVTGIAETTATFQSMPIVYTTYKRATSFAPHQRNMLSFILVKASPGTDFQALIQKIKKKTGLTAYTRQEFKDLIVNYYLKFTGMPINFGMSVLLGFFVGAAIAGQTFYNFTQENLRYFGVLKAMGTSQRTLMRMIMLQACTVGIIGYGLGACITYLFYWFSTSHALLAFKFPWQLMLFSIVGVSIICMFAAFLSIYRVFKLEAAIVFKG